MKVAVFNTKSYDEKFLREANVAYNHEIFFFEPHLNLNTARIASGFPAVSVFVNDILDRPVLELLYNQGTRLVALRSAGFNNVDLRAAKDLGITTVRVPAYSPYAVAEHAVALMLALNRKIHRAYNRVREGNFSLEGLLGFDLHGRTVGIIGTGRIGRVVAGIMNGFGCNVVAYDPYADLKYAEESGVSYLPLPKLYESSDIITIHSPLTPATHHMIDSKAISQVKEGVMLINTSRGAIIDTLAVIEGLKSGKIGYLGLDVYEEEEELFFENLSDRLIQDDVFSRLLTFPNVIVTGHQGFFTKDALENIANTTLSNIRDFEEGRPSTNEIKA